MADTALDGVLSNEKRNRACLNGEQTSQKRPRVMSPGRVQEEVTEGVQQEFDVVVVGAGPAGLMLAANLVRFGIKTAILDNRPDKTSTGRADGLQPKTIETLRQMRLANGLLERGVKFYDMCFWSSTSDSPLRRTGREIHYPAVVDLVDPYMILVHQGMVEETFLGDLTSRGVEVTRNACFSSYRSTNSRSKRALEVIYEDNAGGEKTILMADYLVGCDGAHSAVRRSMPGVLAEGASSEAVWGVLDGEIETDFPDFWSKAIVYSHKYGSVLGIPRERGMTRLYIELKSEDGGKLDKGKANQEYVMERAKQILQPYKVNWTSVEWFGLYSIGQRVASHFIDDTERVFIAGDASHTHSLKAAQGMNTSMHDSLNLAWKLNFSVRGIAKRGFLSTYEEERRKIAKDLISFDFEHANAFHDGDPDALALNFMNNIRFISGIGAEYGGNVLNLPAPMDTQLRPGSLLTPAKVTRYIDANPIDIQLDIPMLGQFRMYFICPEFWKTKDALDNISSGVLDWLFSNSSLAQSYAKKPRQRNELDDYQLPERYTAVSQWVTPAFLTNTPKADFEISDLPPIVQDSKWTVHLDDMRKENRNGKHCIQKWIGSMGDSEFAIVNVRPDGYVGSVRRWPGGVGDSKSAVSGLQEYYSSFLAV